MIIPVIDIYPDVLTARLGFIRVLTESASLRSTLGGFCCGPCVGRRTFPYRMKLASAFVQDSGFSSLSSHQRILVVLGGALVLLSYSALLGCAFLSVLSPMTNRFSRYWTTCFILSAAATVGWMGYYAVWFIRGEGVMIFRSNLLMFWLLVLATLLSAFVGFKYPHKYIAASAVALIVAAYSYAFPFLVHGISLFWRK